MNKKKYSVNVWILLVVTGLLIIFTFVLVNHNQSMQDRIKHDRNSLLSTGKAVTEMIKPIK
ncbi:MAG: hypothetical protein WCK68_11060 [Betaproteobacteria bacterium]|jgi:hypothetical protein